jgi:Tannase and feruloyl esterase
MFGAGGTKSYAQLTQDGSTVPFSGPNFSLADEVDTNDNLDTFKKHGGKLLTFVGASDQLIHPRGVINYYRQMASRYDPGFADNIGIQTIDFRHVQKFYRLFRAPGVAHCGGGVGPQPQDLFNVLVNWVEKNATPDTILAKGGAVATRTRPLCPYPQTAIYNGSGSTDDAANFHCGGNLERRKTVCADVLVKYKHEANGPLDYLGTGVNPLICGPKLAHGHHHHDHD